MRRTPLVRLRSPVLFRRRTRRFTCGANSSLSQALLPPSCGWLACPPEISGDGSIVTFGTYAPLLPADKSAEPYDVYVRELAVPENTATGEPRLAD